MVARLSLEQEVYNQTCFHAQQGVEKMLKGYLAQNDKDVPQIHSVGVLLRMCIKIDRGFSEMVDRGIKLDDYYIPTRYPDALPGMFPEGMPGKEDAKEALVVLEEMMRFVEKKAEGLR